MRIMSGVVLALSQECAWALPSMDASFEAITRGTMVITSARDGVHMKGSKHYSGNAFDVRIAGLMAQDVQEVLRVWRRDLKAFDILLESDHIHVEFDPS